jgi:hypothetical protein
MNENAFYDIVAQELQAQTMVPGLWTRAFSEAGGQLDRARALYIKYRVVQLAQEAKNKLQQKQRIEAEATRQRVAAGFWHLIRGLLAIVFMLIALFSLLGALVAFSEHENENRARDGVGFIFIGAFFSALTYVCAKASR